MIQLELELSMDVIARLAIELSRYIFVLLLACFCILSFVAVKRRDEDTRGGIYTLLGGISFLFLTLGVGDLLLLRAAEQDWESARRLLLLYAAEALLLLIYRFLMRLLYRRPQRLLLYEMSMLLSIGFVLLARLNIAHAWRQLVIIALSMGLSLLVPMILHRLGFLVRRLSWGFGAVGVLGLLAVLMTGRLVNGSKLSYQLFGLTFQPSEAVKLLFALLIAGILAKEVSWRRICVSAAAAAAHILILVASKDLGSALIFFIMYVTMLYVASGQHRYLFAGFLAGGIAAVAAYVLFSHVRVRVQIWLDPWGDLDNKGYQLTQSLFGIATGGWFGMGLGHGSPRTIPYVEEDFAFSAVAEEFGTLFGILLILLCLCVTLTMLVLVSRLKDAYCRIAAAGLAVCYGAQVILTIGGGIGFIPLTGVTLPLISNGGTSALVTILLFAMLQGFYQIRMEEAGGEASSRRRERRQRRLEQEREELHAAGTATEEREELHAAGTATEELPDVEAQLEEEESEAEELRYQNNRSVLICALLYAVVYFAMLGKLTYYVYTGASEALVNSYNGKLLAIVEADTVRGTIYSATGRALAYTEVAEDGTRSRIYPYGRRYAHAIGYATHGGLGVEGLAQSYLITSGASLATKLRNDAAGATDAGNDVYTTLLPELQESAYTALGDRQGAVIVTDVETGAVLAMVSKPDFDPAQIDAIWDDLLAEEDNSTLVNRAAQGLYPPGSTFKILTLLEYLREHEEDYEDYQFDCVGNITIEGSMISCYHGGAHGEVDLLESFAKSCNSSFANLGVGLDRTAFAELLLDMHFNEALPTDFRSNPSHVSMREEMTTNDMLQTVIGQSETAMTPLHLNMVTAAVANGGTMMAPYLIDRIETSDGRILSQTKPSSLGTPLTEEECELLTEYMRAVVEEGTATRIADAAYTVAGKTGSAEFSSDKSESHAWFTGFAPAEAPEVAITVIVENAGSGGAVSVPIARAVLDQYFTR